MVNAQQWLVNEYPNKETINTIKPGSPREGLTGNLVISDWPQLKILNLVPNEIFPPYGRHYGSIPKLEIKNCPNLRFVLVPKIQLKNLSITNCPEIRVLDVNNNQLTELEVSSLTKLEELNCEINLLTNLYISENLKLRKLICDDMVRPLESLVLTIEQKEREAIMDGNLEQLEKITELEQEIQSLKELKQRLETNFQQKETELTTELNQIKEDKKLLESKFQDQENTLTNLKQQLDNKKFELEECEKTKELYLETFAYILTLTGEYEGEQVSEIKQRFRKNVLKKEQSFILNEINTISNFIRELKDELTKKDQELITVQETNTNKTTNLQKEISELKEQLTTQQNNFKKECKGLESQLTTFAVSTGLLTQQVENLTNQLSESEQKEERSRLESEIKANLIREQGDKITQQELQINNYQQLLRTSEENLKKCQEIISQKTSQLEQLTKEKDLIAEELELANGRIKELEQALLTSETKIQQLETKIGELESKNDNSAELERLKKELTNQKSKSQSEINRLKKELNQTKLREEALAEKIKELGKKPLKTQQITEEKSFWETVKMPLVYGVGAIIVVIVLGWIWSMFKEE